MSKASRIGGPHPEEIPKGIMTSVRTTRRGNDADSEPPTLGVRGANCTSPLAALGAAGLALRPNSLPFLT